MSGSVNKHHRRPDCMSPHKVKADSERFEEEADCTTGSADTDMGSTGIFESSRSTLIKQEPLLGLQSLD